MAFRFRKLDIYKDALELHRFIVHLTKPISRESDYLVNQIRRASLSVILNIAEGSAKSSDKDFRRYLGNSLGSLNELVAGFEVMFLDNLISEDNFKLLESKAETLVNKTGSLFQKLS